MENEVLKPKIGSFIEGPLSKLDWILFIVIAVFCFLAFQQGGDLHHTGSSSIAYLQGHILDFYDYNVQFVGGNAYLPSTYILFAIWNIPAYLFKFITGPDVINFLSVRMWFKVLPVLFYMTSGFLMYKIGQIIGLGNKKSKLMAYIFLTAPLAFFSQFIFGQYDIFTVFFILLGTYFYLKDDIWKFIIFFGIAVTFKYFALLIFVPLLLLKEKNILKIGRNMIIFAIPIILEILLYFRSLAFRSGVFGFGATNYMFEAGFQTSFMSIKIVVVLFIVVCAWAYFTNTSNKMDLMKWNIYITNVVVFLMFGLSIWHPQWLILATPFMVMGAMVNKHFDTFMIMDILLMLVFTIFTVNTWVNNVDHDLLRYGIFNSILGEGLGSIVTMRSLFIIKDKNLMFSIISGLFLVNAIFKHPKFMAEHFDESIDKHWPIVRLRFLAGVGIWIIPSLIVMFALFY